MSGPEPPARRPLSRAALEAADGTELPDLVRPGLRLLLVGINPGRRSGATGFHFGNPRNHLWPALHQSGLTPRLLRPEEGQELLALGIGITNLVMRTTRGSNDLTDQEYRDGAAVLRQKVATLRPKVVAILGKVPYERGFGVRNVAIGRQPGGIEGSELWVLPNPSPINASSQLPDHIARFTDLRRAVED